MLGASLLHHLNVGMFRFIQVQTRSYRDGDYDRDDDEMSVLQVEVNKDFNIYDGGHIWEKVMGHFFLIIYSIPVRMKHSMGK